MFVVLVVSGVQHVDCVTFSTLSFFSMNNAIRERERKKKKEKRKREKNSCFCKRCCFLLLVPGSVLEKFAAIVNPENKPTKVNWTLSWPSALEICGKMFFNKGLISGLILLGKVWALNLAIACGKGLPFFSWLQDQLWKSSLQL